MKEPKPKKASPESPGVSGQAAVRAPAKGDSSASDVPREEEGATFVGGPSAPPIDSSAAAGDLTFVDPSPTPAAGQPRLSNIFPKQNQLQPGDVLGGRFEILDVLGEGGMGTVYKAMDREVDHIVALKLIRPEMAVHPAILARFKQELLTARQVTHKNVIRIHDLSEVDGVKFITMEFVEGCDLRQLLLDNGKLSPERAVEIIRQVCMALEAAHSAGVIHRDLKPQNVMQDKLGRILVMDFGLARSLLESGGMTQTGVLMGTIEYMSPEQALGKHLDGRSDLFAVGLIFYELLTCKLPFKAETAMASLLKRNQERALPAAELDASIPRGLSDIVSKCLERDPNLRYQSAREILDDLDAWQGKRPISASVVMPVPAPQRVVPLKWISVAAAALLLLVGTPIVIQRLTHKTPTQHALVSVLVADFTNHTGDPVFNGTLEPMFNVALEGASFINAYNRGSARKLAQKLPNPTDKLDEQPARLVAVSEGISAVITGEISRRGNDYSISAIALDAVTGNVIAQAQVNAANKDDVLRELGKLAAPIRKGLGDTMPESAQLEAVRGPLTAASLEAVHEYGMAMEQQSAGRREEALVSFAKTAELDPGFARAYSGMAASSLVLGKLQDAEKHIKLALQHEDRMTDRERYRVRGLYYFVVGNFQKCIEEYTELVNRYPVDNIGQGNLAACYIRLRNPPKAVEAARRAVAIVPKYAVQRLYLSFYTSYGGDFQGGEREARAALALSPSPEGYLALAEAQVGEGQSSQAAETYKSLAKVSALGASMAASGLADIDLYEGRFTEAMRKLEQGAAADVAAKRLENAADKLATLGYIQLLRGERGAAVAAVDKALADNQSVKIRFLAAQIFTEAGQGAKAQKLANGLASELEAEPRAYAKIIAADLAVKRGDAREAIKALTEANTLLDTWIGHFELGRVYLQSGLFVEADSEFDRCVKRRGEALELFMDNVPTFGYFPPVYYLQGRVREGLKSPGFAESYRNYLSIRGQAGEDPLLPGIHRRLGEQASIKSQER